MNKIKSDIIIITTLTILLLAVLIFAAGNQTLSPAKQIPEAGTGEYRLPVFGTSDIHGALVGEIEEPHKYMMAFIADKVDDARMTENGIDPGRTVLIDGGDIYQGNMVSNVVQGESLSAAFDVMEYDAVGVGNHEFDWDLETVIDPDRTMRDYTSDGKACENDIPVICCNLYKDGRRSDLTRDYVILEKKAYDASGNALDVKIGVIGFAEEYSLSVGDKKFEALGYSITEDYDEVNRFADELENEKGCDATILLAHGDAGRIAESLGSSTDVDIVYGGHTHRQVNDVTEWGLRYMAPSGKGYSYMYSELVFENDGEGGARIKEGADDRAELVKTAEDESLLYDTEENADQLDQKITDITNVYLNKVMETLSGEIGYIEESVTRSKIGGSDQRTTVASNFVCDAMKREAGADVAFVNMGGVRADLRLKEGSQRRTVTILDIYSMLPFDDTMYCYEITYGDLLDVMKYSVTSGGRSLLSSMTGMDCYFIEDPTDDGSSGEKYKRRIVNALVKDGQLIWKDGEWTGDWKDRKIRIAVSDFSATNSRIKGAMDNPLCGYNDTDKLISKDGILREIVIDALQNEAAENDGYLHVDTQTHFIFREYDGK